MSSDSDAGPHHKRKRKIRRLEDSPASTSSSGSPIIGSSSRIRRRPFQEKNPIQDSSESDSDSGSLIHIYNKRKKVMKVRSDTDSESSGSNVVKRVKRTGRIESETDVESDRGFEGSSSSQWETDLSGPEGEVYSEVKKKPVGSKEIEDNGDSDSSDGQSEKCPICLLSFKSQEIGVPESCDHLFCLECIQEWSKNMNTCPVDRQEFNLILVRKNVDGKVIRQVPIEKPAPQNDVNIVEDPTFCEICGTSDNEDRMLLCDGCDLGFHLYCLTPPLEDIPPGAWFCNDCSPDDEYESDIELYEIQLLLDDAEFVERPLRTHRNQFARLIPRTRQSERVRRRIANNRQQNVINNPLDHPSASSSLEDSLLIDTVSSTTSRSRSYRPRKLTQKSKQIRYKIVYEIDETTGEVIPVKKRKRRNKKIKRKRRRVRTERPAVRPKTVKKRLAAQLGICAPRTVAQSLPDVKIQNSLNTLGGMRHQAGIPTLHLFGQSNELDYFSDGEQDYIGAGPQLLISRAANRSNISTTRSIVRRKALLTNTVSSSTDILDSILNSQEQFHSRNASYSIDSSGNFKIEQRKSQNNNYINVNEQTTSMRQRPNSYRNQNPENNPSYNRSNMSNYHSHHLDQYHSAPTSTMESASTSNFSGGGREQNELPQDYTQRTLCASNEGNNQGKKDKDEDNTGTNTPNSESEIDIYSDIETVSTSKVDDGDLKPPSPPILSITPNTGTDDDNNDSEPDMVIDDEKIQEPEKILEDSKEETTVTSTVGFSSEFISTNAHSATEMPHSSMEIQSGAIQSSNLMENKNNEDDDDYTDGCPNTSIYSKESINVLKDTEDVDSDDGCPNFSIYSKESKSVALHTDISLSAEDNTQTQEYQVGEISSSPNIGGIQEDFMPYHPSTHLDEMINYSSDRNTDENQTGDNLETTFSDDILQDNNKEDKSTEDKSSHAENDLNQKTQSEVAKTLVSGGILGGLYSDSEDETVVKKDNNSFAISDINHMTEDISEEERSYTPCLDERGNRQGLEGLDTELISDEDRNDFDESHELKTVSDGDALEINAKESELDFTRPEDYEEGEIVDKNKGVQNQKEPEKEKKKSKPKNDTEGEKDEKKSKKKEKEKDRPVGDDKSGNKENEVNSKESSFKKLSKNTKERNYRDKDKDMVRQRSPSKPPEDREQNKKERKREKRKELERYNVRAIIAEKPRPQIVKDQFGRDIRRTPTRSRSRSYTPPIETSPSRVRQSPAKNRRSVSRRRSLSRTRKSTSKEKSVRKRRPRSRNRSLTRSRSRSQGKTRSKTKKRKRSSSRYDKRRKSRDRSKNKKKPRSRSRQRSRSATPTRRKRGWNRREWSPMSMSHSPEPHHNMSPSWTPPRLVDNSQTLRNENLTVLLNNTNKKKKEKRRKTDKRSKETTEARPKKRRRERERTPPPSKEVFASGDNILVSVSFNNENEVRDVTTRDRRKKDMEDNKKKKRKQNRNRRDLSGIKPVAIIDLERSPFKEITPSPKDVIVLSDSDNNDNEDRNVQKNICDSSQQVASPERSINYSMGPKTPPEPQVKFSISAKPPQVRAINNPLHEPDDMENNDDVQEEINSRINEVLHKGPNTPPEPPNSPPSSPDVYDPFEPTKSRSPTPDPMQTAQSNISINLEDNNENMESRSAIDLLEKSATQTPDVMKSLTPPIADIQPADSQSSIHATPESNIGKSPERIGVVINQTVQPAMSTSKPVAQTTPFSSVPTSMITSTPVSSNLAPSRINILNSTIITPPHVVSSIPQRIVLPNQVKSSPVKISPTKATIKSTPIKPMPNKNNKSNARKNRTQNTATDDVNLDFDSPYSPGSSDYEDLFEPPTENIIKSSNKSTSKNNTKPSQKHQSTFDALFGSPNFHKNKNKSNDKFKFGKKSITPTKTKTVGVKLDEDNLKILDELPNSAVEMQVKDKFLKKLNRQERVVEEVKLVLKPHYNKKRITKEEYKDILRRSVPKICHNKSGEINPTKIKNLIEAYVKKIRHSKKVTSSSSVNLQKV